MLPTTTLRHLHQQEIVDGETTTRSWRAPPFTQEVSRVCGPCNHDWMSNLEGAAKPILTPMLQGRRRTLHRESQRTLATWAFKTAVMFEYVHPQTAAIPDDHRLHLYEHGEPPKATHVWLMGYSAELPATYRQFGFSVNPSGPIPAGVGEDVEAYATTFSIGHLACQVAGLSGFDIVRKGGLQPSIREIWPDGGESFICPAGPVLNTGELVAVQESFSNT